MVREMSRIVAARGLSLPKSQIRAYRWCSPPRIGWATMFQNRSIARVQGASRVRPAMIRRVLIDHTCFGRSGGFAPISLPLFQGVRVGLFNRKTSLSDMVVLLGY
jgi:hypothetical protein